VAGSGPAGVAGRVGVGKRHTRPATHRRVFLRRRLFDLDVRAGSARGAKPHGTDIGDDAEESPMPTSSSTSSALTVPAHVLPQRTPGQLLASARQGLAEAAVIRSDGLRYATAHLAALRAAAAVLAARARPAPASRNRVTNVWTLLMMVAPEFHEWAWYFAAGAHKRAAAEAGIRNVVTTREADDLLRAAEQFVGLVEETLGEEALGVARQPTLDESA